MDDSKPEIMLKKSEHKQMTLTEVLAHFDMFSSAVASPSGKRAVFKNDAPFSIPEFIGDSKETWAWLRKEGRIES